MADRRALGNPQDVLAPLASFNPLDDDDYKRACRKAATFCPTNVLLVEVFKRFPCAAFVSLDNNTQVNPPMIKGSSLVAKSLLHHTTRMIQMQEGMAGGGTLNYQVEKPKRNAFYNEDFDEDFGILDTAHNFGEDEDLVEDDED